MRIELVIDCVKGRLPCMFWVCSDGCEMGLLHCSTSNFKPLVVEFCWKLGSFEIGVPFRTRLGGEGRL